MEFENNPLFSNFKHYKQKTTTPLKNLLHEDTF